MKKYLRYLLLDIEAAKRNVPRPPLDAEKSDIDFVGAEEYLHSPLITMGERFGLNPRIFPPVDRWTDIELRKVVKAILKLWFVYNYDADFPAGIDFRLKYILLTDALNSEVPWVSVGIVTIDFCDSDTKNCLLGEHCVCKEFVDSFWEMPSEEAIVLEEPHLKVDISPSMQRYFEQLISDLKDAIDDLPVEEYEDDDEEDYFEEEDDFLNFIKGNMFSKNEEEEEDMEYLDKEIDEEEIKPLSEWLKIPKELFPDLSQLSVNMRIELVHAIEKLWWHAGYIPCFPTGVSIEKKYKLFRENWDKEVAYPSYESIYINFCTEDQNSCIFGQDMCDCKKYGIQAGDLDGDDLDNFLFENDVNDLPF